MDAWIETVQLPTDCPCDSPDETCDSHANLCVPEPCAAAALSARLGGSLAGDGYGSVFSCDEHFVTEDDEESSFAVECSPDEDEWRRSDGKPMQPCSRLHKKCQVLSGRSEIPPSNSLLQTNADCPVTHRCDGKFCVTKTCPLDVDRANGSLVFDGQFGLGAAAVFVCSDGHVYDDDGEAEVKVKVTCRHHGDDGEIAWVTTEGGDELGDCRQGMLLKDLG